MKKCLSWVPGNPSWRLRAHFEPKAWICVILGTFPGQNGMPFSLMFGNFLDAIFNTFSDASLEGTFCKIWCQMPPKWEAFGSHFEDIFWDRWFLDFWYPSGTKPYVLRSGGCQKWDIFDDFLEGVLQEAPWEGFLKIFDDFGLPGGPHLASKRHQKQGSEKVMKMGTYAQRKSSSLVP